MLPNMARPAQTADLEPYRPALERWLPKADVRRPPGTVATFDGLLVLRVAGKPVRYLIQEKRHFRHLDAAVIADQLIRRRAELPREHTGHRILLLAPHVRAYRKRDLLRLLDGLPVRVAHHTRIFGAYDNIIARFPRLGRLLRGLLHAAERTPLRLLGLSHFLVIEKT